MALATLQRALVPRVLVFVHALHVVARPLVGARYGINCPSAVSYPDQTTSDLPDSPDNLGPGAS
jgi:hypothetical protein